MSKAIKHSLLKMFHSGNTREPVEYTQPKMQKELLKEIIGTGIHIGHLMEFNSNHELHRSATQPVDRHFEEVNDVPQPVAPSGADELHSTFIFGHKSQN